MTTRAKIAQTMVRIVQQSSPKWCDTYVRTLRPDIQTILVSIDEMRRTAIASASQETV